MKKTLDIRLRIHYIDSYETRLHDISNDYSIASFSFPARLIFVLAPGKPSSLISSAACLFFSTFGLVPRVLKLFIGEF
jgi:hypothetical protein